MVLTGWQIQPDLDGVFYSPRRRFNHFYPSLYVGGAVSQKLKFNLENKNVRIRVTSLRIGLSNDGEELQCATLLSYLLLHFSTGANIKPVLQTWTAL